MEFTLNTLQSTSPNNIVLVGSTGAGKSTFGNWIASFGQGTPIFEMGGTAEPCTQDVIARVVRVSPESPLALEDDPTSVQLNLIDTPGLNEEDATKDLKHMCELLAVMHKLKKISCVVICMEYGFKRDAPNSATLQYYRKLFQPVFDAGNVVIALTKVDGNDLEMYTPQQWDSALEQRREVISQMLEYKVGNIFALNSRFAQFRLNKVLDKRPPGAIIYPTDSALLMRSLISRMQFIILTSQLRPISMQDHLFSLPPCIDSIRKNQLGIIEERCEQLQNTLAIENEMSGMFIKQEIDLTNQMFELKNSIDTNEQLQRTKKQIQRTDAQIASGDEIFFRTTIEPLIFNCPLPTFETEVQKYNCEFTKLQHLPGSNYHKYKPMPDTFCVIRTTTPGTEEKVRWFLRMQLAYSGEEYYKHDIDILMKDKADLEARIERLKIDKKELEMKHREKQAKIEGHQKYMNTLTEQKEIFAHDCFALSKIPQLISHLQLGEKF